MKRKRNSDLKNSNVVFNKDERTYIKRIEAFLLNLLRTKPMSFQDIVCLAEGAYPTDVLQALQNLVLSKNLKRHGELYCVQGLKSKSERSQFADTPLFPESQSTLNPANSFADPHLADYDWRYSAKAREEITKRLRQFIECNSEIAFFGAPTLFLSLYRKKLHLTLFDSSSSILADLESSGVSNGLVHHNLFDSLPEFSDKFDVIVADPPWYMPFHKAFILRSSEFLKELGLLMLSVPPWLTRPDAVADRSEIVTFAAKAGFNLSEVAPGVLLYECPKFEKIALAMQGVRCGNWRLGDLFIFRKIRQAIPSLKVSYPKDEPRWDEYRLGNIKIKIRQQAHIDSGKLKIKYVSDCGPFLATVSRRYPLKSRIDLWTSNNVAYSIKRVDIVKFALDKLQSGESPKTVIEGLDTKLAKTELRALLELLTNITTPYEIEDVKHTRRPQSIVGKRSCLDSTSYVKDFILSNVLPSVRDSFWQQRLSETLLDSPFANDIHLAVFVGPYLELILEGRKTVESRFSSRRCAPYQRVRSGDILLLKRSSGPVVGLCEVGSVWFYRLDAESWQIIKTEFAQALCVQDPSFWENRQHASYATLMRIQHVCPIAPTKFVKYDRRGWVRLTDNDVQGQIRLQYG